MRICIRPGISIEPVLITVKIKFFDAKISAFGRLEKLTTNMDTLRIRLAASDH